ncbi:MAG: family 78 glycoside hydrolase catalytic domain, partial [Chthonomonadaceae bacterium]|nr:family 78 glycoside hydrolase catalytic domain [Chthonomonadaceae bacterium]
MAELRWTARWISYGQHPTDDLGVYCFRRKFSLPDVSGSFPIKVSADQRYHLTLNGKRIGEGPQRGDLAHWFFEEYDLAHHLVAGENVLEAVVWSFGRYAPMAQHTHRLAFVLQGSGVSTPNGWKVRRCTDVQFDMLHGEVGPFYIDVGPGEIHTSDLLPSEDDWRNPNVVGHVLERGEFAGDSPWFLLPRTLPAMKLEEWHGSPLIVNRDTNERQVCETLVVHPGERALLDFGELHAGYPHFTFEGQPGTVVTINYGEALFDERGHKGDRNDVRNKRIQGYQDRFILKENGSSEHRFSTLWWRTFRYLQLQSDNPVRLSRIRVEKTGYPYSVESSFKGDDPWIEKIWDAGIRTAKLCAGETYFDCPYYEQLQYAGDTRIQILLHSFLSRDRRLQRNAVEQFSWSLLPSGLTQSRYPSRVQQVIPPFSLFWILMLMDQVLYDEVAPSDLVRNRAWASNILANFPDPSGSEPFWFFFDWLDTWPMGVPRNTLLKECTNMLLQAAQ